MRRSKCGSYKCIGCDIPHAPTFGSGCEVASCGAGYKVSDSKTACVACSIPHATSYAADCAVAGCESGYTVAEDGTACTACAVPHAQSFGSGCEVASCDAGYKLSEGACIGCSVPPGGVEPVEATTVGGAESFCVCCIGADGTDGILTILF